ncbi:MAG: YgiQ family radical SAM protein, partial [Desulfobacterales bacterium]|nr:YgiQ family radical SAM protein [Desulfobacterales bacterium]
MFLPTTPAEVEKLGWTQLDIILVTGDTYIDSPFMGVSLIGKLLMDKGFRVGIIAQPRPDVPEDISRLGEPALFWGVTGGAVDSMVANYTALGKRRKTDDYTPGCQNTRRPDRAVIAYSNLIRRFFKNTAPIVLGGIEASLRRIAHYDFWSNKIRRSILFDAKADFLLFGMAHDTVLELARVLKKGQGFKNIRGLGYISREPKGLELPDFDRVKKDKAAYTQSFNTFYDNCDPITAQGICQAHGDRYMVLNPPPLPSTTQDLDRIHDLDFEREVHPHYAGDGPVRALDTIRFSIPTHYGCYGECNFCAIAVHQGRTVQYRSKESVVQEAKALTRHPRFKGNIMDLGGPTANMYGYECEKKLTKGACKDRRCLFPKICKSLRPDHRRHLELIRKIEALPQIKKVFINSGIRYDLILADPKHGKSYL